MEQYCAFCERKTRHRLENGKLICCECLPAKAALMSRGPKGEKRPANAIGNAIMIAKIATGEIEHITTEGGWNAGAAALGAWVERRGRKA